MFNSQVLDVALGLVFLYFFLSLLCSVIIESITALLKKRPRMLREAISHLLGDKAALEKLYEQPLFLGHAPKGSVSSFFESLLSLLPPLASWLDRKKVPSYIAPRSFVLSLLESLKQHPEVIKNILSQKSIVPPDDISKVDVFKAKLQAYAVKGTITSDLDNLVQNPAMSEADKLDKIREWYNKPEVLAELIKPFQKEIPSLDQVDKLINLLPDENTIKKAVGPLLEATGNKLDKALDSMEKWYEDAMDRVTGWYKRYSQAFALILAFLVALGLNADTFAVGKTLYNDQVMRSAMVTLAAESVKQPLPKQAAEGKPVDWEKKLQTINKDYQKISSVNLPLGWDKWWEQSKETLKSQGIINKAGAVENKGGLLWFWFITSFPGLLFTAFMVSLGSNFWFELLSKFINMRNAGKKPATTEEKAKK